MPSKSPLYILPPILGHQHPAGDTTDRVYLSLVCQQKKKAHQTGQGHSERITKHLR